MTTWTANRAEDSASRLGTRGAVAGFGDGVLWRGVIGEEDAPARAGSGLLSEVAGEADDEDADEDDEERELGGAMSTRSVRASCLPRSTPPAKMTATPMRPAIPSRIA